MNSNHKYVCDRLASKYPLTTQGTWRIVGEDPNCDFGGHHHQPELGTVTGTYERVIEYALDMPGFFQWGSGGDITLITATVDVDKIDPKRTAFLKKERVRLQDSLKVVEEELAKAGHK